ncbi:LPS export ABC transporter periplasmic protein LptC [Aerophototrophica crusticola]|uniref:LPS export ABC transporter periplasmic protein LptC n=1 Tax=Aerophototrophica crusticola TaxID=1709002 RepID=A0A858R3P4_9PROT|nr:LPS export ABC transporter periplasmic protein LptC [Rhodospirillaceae bacterium B3]
MTAPTPSDGARPDDPTARAERHAAAAAAMAPRRRGGPRDPHAHTRAVNTAKVALPALAALVLLLVGAWPLVTGDHETRKAGPESGELEMVDARYVGTDQTARPFEVRANRVVQTGQGGKLVELVEPQAEITLQGGDWLSITAERGRYDQTSGHLSLEGKVQFFHDGGYEFLTDQAELDTTKGLAWGDRPVRGQGPFGDIDAGGFRIVDDGNTIVFTGKARLRLDGNGTRRPG